MKKMQVKSVNSIDQVKGFLQRKDVTVLKTTPTTTGFVIEYVLEEVSQSGKYVSELFSKEEEKELNIQLELLSTNSAIECLDVNVTIEGDFLLIYFDTTA